MLGPEESLGKADFSKRQAFSPQTNYRKGGLLSLAAATVGLADLNQVRQLSKRGHLSKTAYKEMGLWNAIPCCLGYLLSTESPSIGLQRINSQKSHLTSADCGQELNILKCRSKGSNTWTLSSLLS